MTRPALGSEVTSKASVQPAAGFTRNPGYRQAQLLLALSVSVSCNCSSMVGAPGTVFHVIDIAVGPSGVHEVVEVEERLGGFVGELVSFGERGSHVTEPACEVVEFSGHTSILSRPCLFVKGRLAAAPPKRGGGPAYGRSEVCHLGDGVTMRMARGRLGSVFHVEHPLALVADEGSAPRCVDAEVDPGLAFEVEPPRFVGA